jgi:hypothetical protein
MISFLSASTSFGLFCFAIAFKTTSDPTTTMSEGQQLDTEVQQSHLMLLSELQFAYSVNALDSVKQQIHALIVQHSCVSF